MSSCRKYRPYVALSLPNRQWPSRRTTRHPVWLSTDLRDGNQSLPQPMTIDEKLTFFRHLVKTGFEEIEVAYPSASDTEFNFVRRLIENNEIPDNVWIQIMTPARPELIERTFESLAGAKKVIIHFYNASCPCFRDVVYGKTKEEVLQMSLEAADTVRRCVNKYKARYGTLFRPSFSLEAFSQTEPDYAIEVVTAVREKWGANPDGPMIVNLAATVEIGPPNHFADQIEYFCTHFKYRDEVIVSVHTHNDRGCAVAASEMALLAGAQRIEGTLFGNGERTGNVDLVTLALNLYTQGIDPSLDFSDIQASIDLVTRLTNLPVHPRHPYAGALVYTAFSGAHQDAIKKGLERQAARWAEADAAGLQRIWEVPYLPMDPADVGRDYEGIIRINSQSGKGGVAYVIKKELGIDMPRAMQQEFYRLVQAASEEQQTEVGAVDIVQGFCRAYSYGESAKNARIVLGSDSACTLAGSARSDTIVFRGDVIVAGGRLPLEGSATTGLGGFIDAARSAFGLTVHIHQKETQRKDHSQLLAFTLISSSSTTLADATWGIGVDTSQDMASIRAVVSAVNRLVNQGIIDISALGVQQPALPMGRMSHGTSELEVVDHTLAPVLVHAA